MRELGSIVAGAAGSIYARDLAEFAIAATMVAVLIWLLDWVGIWIIHDSSLIRAGFGREKSIQSFLVWGLGAGLAAYVGGLAGLFDVESRLARVIVGVSWPTVLPRLIDMSAAREPEDQQPDVADDEIEEG